MTGERLDTPIRKKRKLEPPQELVDTISMGIPHFFLDMSNPTVDTIEKLLQNLIKLPQDGLDRARATVWSTLQLPITDTLVKSGHKATVAREIEKGMINTETIMHDLISELDYDHLDPKRIAKNTHERFAVQTAEQDMDRQVELIRNEPDLKKRRSIGIKLKKDILAFAQNFDVRFSPKYGRDKTLEPTWKNLTENLEFNHEIHIGNSYQSGGRLNRAVTEAHAAIKRFNYEKKLNSVPKIDRVEFESLRQVYGSKAANLMILAGRVQQLNGLRDKFDNKQLAVPEFRAVPTDIYTAWVNGVGLDEKLQEYFDWANGLENKNYWDEILGNCDYIVRSSAVNSEDGENVTGAGIYESVVVQANSGYEAFKEAVLKVYESAQSEKAKSYRKMHGIGEEKMGLVIQKHIKPHDFFSIRAEKSANGYINSSTTGIPELMEIVTKSSRNFIRRKDMDAYLALDADRNTDNFYPVHHFAPDTFIADEAMMLKASQLTLEIEKIWGCKIQIEFVFSNLHINCVQVREIPNKSLDEINIPQFPETGEIHSGAAIGIGDSVLNVLSCDEYNGEKTGVVVIPTNLMWSMEGSPDELPKSGAVIIKGAGGENGHIQTLCAEAGLICIFPDINQDYFTRLGFQDLEKHDRLRIISNGIEGRVYKTD